MDEDGNKTIEVGEFKAFIKFYDIILLICFKTKINWPLELKQKLNVKDILKAMIE